MASIWNKFFAFEEKIFEFEKSIQMVAISQKINVLTNLYVLL